MNSLFRKKCLHQLSTKFNWSVRELHVIKTIKEMRMIRRELYGRNSTVGFVPTMGALHEGHLALVKESINFNDITMVSIFVNPTQFGKHEDLDKYPRQLEKDIHLLDQLKVDYVFTPSVNEMYPQPAVLHVEPNHFNKLLEGQSRPDFFRGVATVVCKLFNIVNPTTAYFGQKDIWQCILIQKMVDDLNIPTHIKVCETVRWSDGLALSSRNAYLNGNERDAAAILWKALQACKEYLEDGGIMPSGKNRIITHKEIHDVAANILMSEPLVKHIDYISFANHRDMREIEEYDRDGKTCGAVLSLAVQMGDALHSVRLIDNVLIGMAVYDILGKPHVV